VFKRYAHFQVADSTAPDTTITAQPANPTNSTSASFSFTGSDNVTPAANLTFECKLDSGAFAACTSPKSLSNLADGSHTFQVRAIDEAGNVDVSPASYTWTVDTTAPTITLTKPAEGDSYIVGEDVKANYTCSDGTGSGIASCVGSQNNQNVANGAAIDTSFGSHSYTVNATDNAGNAATVTHNYGVSYYFVGWFQPVDGNGSASGTVNQGKVGRTYPIKWQLKEYVNGSLQLISDTAAQNLVSSMSGAAKNVPCGSWASSGTDVLEDYTTGSTQLRYDATSDQFIYNYKAPSNAVCQTFVVSKADGSTAKQANFQFVK
jgi:hypothetical protein